VAVVCREPTLVPRMTRPAAIGPNHEREVPLTNGLAARPSFRIGRGADGAVRGSRPRGEQPQTHGQATSESLQDRALLGFAQNPVRKTS
jgi:hypothetical protein